MRAPLAGAVAGIAALATFLVVHALWILPIWSIAPAGAAIAAAGGAAVGWAYALHRARLPAARWARALVVAAAGALVLAPAEAIALARGPVDMSVLARMTLAEAWPALALYFAVATLVGAALGALGGRSWRATLATALAALLFAIGIGHNAPLLGYGFVALKMWSIMMLATLVAGGVLVALERPPPALAS